MPASLKNILAIILGVVIGSVVNWSQKLTIYDPVWSFLNNNNQILRTDSG